MAQHAEDRAARNKRTGLILGAVAVVFFIGVFVRMTFFGR